MKRSEKNEAYPVRISLYSLILAVFWTALVGISLVWVISQQKGKQRGHVLKVE